MAVVVNTQQVSVGAATSTTSTIVPTGIVAGRSLVLLFGNAAGGSGTMTACADTSGSNVWTLPSPPKGGVTAVTNTFMAVAYVHNCALPGTITVTGNTQTNRKIILLEITGLNNATHDTAAQDITAATALTNVAPAITLSQAGFAIALVNRGGTADPTGITAGWTASTAGKPDLTAPILRAGWQEFGAAGSTGTCGFTFALTGQAGLGMIGFKVGAAPGNTVRLLPSTGVGT